MRDAAVDDVRRRDALGESSDAALRFGRHAAGHHTVMDQLARLRQPQLANQGRRIRPIPQDAWCVSEQHQLLGLQGCGNLSRHRVRIDVVGLAVFRSGGDAGDHRDVAALQEGFEHIRVDAGHVTHQPVAAIPPGPRFHETAVAAAQADCAGTEPVETIDDLLVDAPDQHHLHHIHGVGIGDTKAVTEFRWDLQALQPLVDFGPTTVDHHRLDSHAGQQRQIPEHGIAQLGVGHGGAPVLHHDASASEMLDVRQGLAQDGHPQGVIPGLLGISHRQPAADADRGGRCREGSARHAAPSRRSD